MEAPAHDKDSAPDDVSGFGDSLEGSAAEAEVHGRLSFTGGAAVTADEVGRRSGSRDEEHPDVIIHARTVIGGAPAQVVQSIFGSQAQAAPELVSDQPIQTCAFVHFVEVR